jgi:Asp-tRNA(Asn)/Glu-tRNA(Gln) amidotransferase C subunit
MQKAELDKLLQLTAIELAPEQMPAFLDYFSSMKKMFDEFYNFPLPDDIKLAEDEKSIACFEQGNVFPSAEAILANVEKKRLVGNAIEVKSAFGE